MSVRKILEDAIEEHGMGTVRRGDTDRPAPEPEQTWVDKVVAYQRFSDAADAAPSRRSRPGGGPGDRRSSGKWAKLHWMQHADGCLTAAQS